MAFKEIAAASGLPGLYKVLGSRSNGVILEDIATQKTRFAPMRKHHITPLETVAIYTEEDSTELKDVFRVMQDQQEGNPMPDASSDTKVLFKYFAKIVPNYDRELVKISDVKKLIKWYKCLAQNDLLVLEDDPDEKAKEEKEEE